jgi:hypothetical protein
VWVQGAGFQEDQSESVMIDVAVGFLFCCEDPVLGVYGFCVGCDWLFFFPGLQYWDRCDLLYLAGGHFAESALKLDCIVS